MLCGPGQNPAKYFTPAELEKVKHVYSLRKLLYNKVAELARSSVLATVACDKVYEAYGSLPLTSILRKMNEDMHSENWPEALMIRAE